MQENYKRGQYTRGATQHSFIFRASIRDSQAVVVRALSVVCKLQLEGVWHEEANDYAVELYFTHKYSK